LFFLGDLGIGGFSPGSPKSEQLSLSTPPMMSAIPYPAMQLVCCSCFLFSTCIWSSVALLSTQTCNCIQAVLFFSGWLVGWWLQSCCFQIRAIVFIGSSNGCHSLSHHAIWVLHFLFSTGIWSSGALLCKQTCNCQHYVFLYGGACWLEVQSCCSFSVIHSHTEFAKSSQACTHR